MFRLQEIHITLHWLVFNASCHSFAHPRRLLRSPGGTGNLGKMTPPWRLYSGQQRGQYGRIGLFRYR